MVQFWDLRIKPLQINKFCITFYYPNDHKIVTTTLHIQLVHSGDIRITTANHNNIFHPKRAKLV